MEDNKQSKIIHNHFEEGSNCQVFNGSISGCIFAMPGSNVYQQIPPTNNEKKEDEDISDNEDEEDKKIINELTPCFYSNRQEAESFLKKITSMEPKDITGLVKELVKSKIISELSSRRPLWTILNKYGLYNRSEANWNSRIK